VESFRTLNNNINCLELTETEWQKSMQVLRYFIKGGTIRCYRMAARYAPVAFSETNTALSEKHIKSPSPPVSCAGLLAQKMGVSDMHTVMAAGFAGGIGLSGEACGALGTAIWLTALNSQDDEKSKMEYFSNPEFSVVIERFLESSDYEFECSAIVGRKFKDVADHAAHVQAGGWSQIIDALSNFVFHIAW